LSLRVVHYYLAEKKTPIKYPLKRNIKKATNSINVYIYQYTYFKKLGKSSDTAPQPGQRQSPLTNRTLVPSELLKETEMSSALTTSSVS